MKKGDSERIVSSSLCAIAMDMNVVSTDARIEWPCAFIVCACCTQHHSRTYLDPWVDQQGAHPVYLRKLGKVPSALGNIIRKRHQ